MRFGHLALIGACLVTPAPVHAGAEFLGRFLWERPEPYFGGLSGIEVSPDGREFLVIGDNAIVLSGRFERASGKVVGVTYDPSWIGGLSMPRGERVGEGFSDSEGLAVGPDGRIYVSFERTDRVWAYADPDAKAEPLPDLPRDLHFPRNGGLEGLALAPDGAIWAFPELPPWDWDALPVLRLAGSHWDIVDTLPRDRSFRPVGADFDDKGQLWLLERWFGFRGFASRVRVFAPGPDGLGEAKIVLETEPGTHGNLEGLATWRDADGALVLTMVADDNYNRFQVTEIVEYLVTE